jgi:hypothetical protein
MGSSTSTTYTIGGLSSGTLYYFKVAAVNTGGAGPLSSPAHATTQTVQTGGGTGRIEVYNTSSVYYISAVYIYDIFTGETQTDQSGLAIGPGQKVAVENIPSGKEYAVFVVDNYGYEFAVYLTLAPNTTRTVTYDGWSLTVDWGEK